MVSNVQAGFPAEIALSRNTLSIDATSWPTGQLIRETLSQYHKKKFAL